MVHLFVVVPTDLVSSSGIFFFFFDQIFPPHLAGGPTLIIVYSGFYCGLFLQQPGCGAGCFMVMWSESIFSAEQCSSWSAWLSSNTRLI